jgi:putative FmdB family regulatory protein
MPTYLFVCEDCGHEGLGRLPVEERDLVGECPDCQGRMPRRFTTTSACIVPEHFKYLARWCLPDKSDTEAWDARANPSQVHIRPPERPSLKDHLMDDLLGGEKIRLSG